MRRTFIALTAVLLLSACDSQLTASDCDAECDKVRILARRGDPSAQTSLGLMYFKGDGVQKDETRAVSLWHKAADQDYAPAQDLLGQAYSCGIGGLTPDKAKANELFQQAADGGSEVAHYVTSKQYVKSSTPPSCSLQIHPSLTATPSD